ncbi:MAG: hypothetical protein NT012_01540 [Candidatus Nealsonbacteria bacterium]|nr:hypothetical protein [Candidatus Nealsonbacteria bacterium]
MGFKKAFKLLIICLVILFSANIVLAGFGISPPYVINDRLVPGAHYEQKISLSRSDPEEDLKVQVTIDAPEIENWFLIDRGKEFIFPKGEKLTYMVVNVDVPENAELKNYKGYIRVRVAPLGAIEAGQVAVALGARIDVDLTVSKGEVFDFLVRFIDILDVKIKTWPLSYFNKIKVLLRVENTGNMESSPTTVHLDVYDVYEKNILESSDDIKLEKIKPFETKEIFAEFSTKLEAGTYYGKIKVFKGEEISREEKIIFAVEDVPFSSKDWTILVGGIFGLLIVLTGLGYGGYKYWRKRTPKKVIEKSI